MDRRFDRGNATRRTIINAAVDLFAEHGYETTSIEMVLQACSVSRGALYHHFDNKEGIFTAVLEIVEERVAQRVAAAAARASNPLDALRGGAAAWLDLANDPVVRRIVLIDAPSVVGWQAWRTLEDRYALGLLKATLAGAAAAGRLPLAIVDTTAHALLASLIEMSLLLVRNPDDRAMVTAAHETVETLITHVMGFSAHGAWEPAPNSTATRSGTATNRRRSKKTR